MKCKLCGEEKELRNSHIIPEFFYKPIYDEKHRLRIIAASDEYRNFEQKGLYERLLCNDCEEHFNKLETYTANLFNRDRKIKARYFKENITLYNIDYAKFKLFQLSVLWRSSVSSLNFFSDIKLGPHENKIKLMLLNNDPGKYFDYGCVMVFHLTSAKEILDGIIYKPYMAKSLGHRIFVFMFGSALWLFIVSSHTSEYIYKDFFLKTDGSLKIKRIISDQFLQSIADTISRAGKLPID